MADPAANENVGRSSEEAEASIEFGESQRCQFRLFQADWVSFNSSQCAGGDWRWQFCSPSGEILSESIGYQSEAEGRAAILRLQNEAAYAIISTAER